MPDKGGAVWFLPSPDGEGSVILGAHREEACKGRTRNGCALHNPSMHPLRDCAMRWIHPPGRMERLCPHGIWVPDPDDQEWAQSQGRDPGGTPCLGCGIQVPAPF